MPNSDESSEFGWQHFTCSDKQDKLSYLLTCLKDKFLRRIQMPSLFGFWDRDKKDWQNYLDETAKTLSEIENSLFKEWVKTYLGFENFDVGGYVDHQSRIHFPFDRSGEKIHAEFAKDFINEFVNNNWYVFGGNDNQENPDPPIPDEKSDFEDFKTIWHFLTDSGDHICVKDPLTEEYVLSNMDGRNYNGSIIKIKF